MIDTPESANAIRAKVIGRPTELCPAGHSDKTTEGIKMPLPSLLPVSSSDAYSSPVRSDNPQRTPHCTGDKLSPLIHHCKGCSPTVSSPESPLLVQCRRKGRIRFRCPSVDLIVSPSTATSATSSSKLSISCEDIDLSASNADSPSNSWDQVSPSLFEEDTGQYKSAHFLVDIACQNEVPISYDEMESTEHGGAQRVETADREGFDLHSPHSPVDTIAMPKKPINGHLDGTKETTDHALVDPSSQNGVQWAKEDIHSDHDQMQRKNSFDDECGFVRASPDAEDNSQQSIVYDPAHSEIGGYYDESTVRHSFDAEEAEIHHSDIHSKNHTGPPGSTEYEDLHFQVAEETAQNHPAHQPHSFQPGDIQMEEPSLAEGTERPCGMEMGSNFDTPSAPIEPDMDSYQTQDTIDSQDEMKHKTEYDEQPHTTLEDGQVAHAEAVHDDKPTHPSFGDHSPPPPPEIAFEQHEKEGTVGGQESEADQHGQYGIPPEESIEMHAGDDRPHHGMDETALCEVTGQHELLGAAGQGEDEKRYAEDELQAMLGDRGERKFQAEPEVQAGHIPVDHGGHLHDEANVISLEMDAAGLQDTMESPKQVMHVIPDDGYEEETESQSIPQEKMHQYDDLEDPDKVAESSAVNYSSDQHPAFEREDEETIFQQQVPISADDGLITDGAPIVHQSPTDEYEASKEHHEQDNDDTVSIEKAPAYETEAFTESQTEQGDIFCAPETGTEDVAQEECTVRSVGAYGDAMAAAETVAVDDVITGNNERDQSNTEQQLEGVDMSNNNFDHGRQLDHPREDMDSLKQQQQVEPVMPVTEPAVDLDEGVHERYNIEHEHSASMGDTDVVAEHAGGQISEQDESLIAPKEYIEPTAETENIPMNESGKMDSCTEHNVQDADEPIHIRYSHESTTIADPAAPLIQEPSDEVDMEKAPGDIPEPKGILGFYRNTECAEEPRVEEIEHHYREEASGIQEGPDETVGGAQLVGELGDAADAIYTERMVEPVSAYEATGQFQEEPYLENVAATETKESNHMRDETETKESNHMRDESSLGQTEESKEIDFTMAAPQNEAHIDHPSDAAHVGDESQLEEKPDLVHIGLTEAPATDEYEPSIESPREYVETPVMEQGETDIEMQPDKGPLQGEEKSPQIEDLQLTRDNTFQDYSPDETAEVHEKEAEALSQSHEHVAKTEAMHEGDMRAEAPDGKDSEDLISERHTEHSSQAAAPLQHIQPADQPEAEEAHEKFLDHDVHQPTNFNESLPVDHIHTNEFENLHEDSGLPKSPDVSPKHITVETMEARTESASPLDQVSPFVHQDSLGSKSSSIRSASPQKRAQSPTKPLAKKAPTPPAPTGASPRQKPQAAPTRGRPTHAAATKGPTLTTEEKFARRAQSHSPDSAFPGQRRPAPPTVSQIDENESATQQQSQKVQKQKVEILAPFGERGSSMRAKRAQSTSKKGDNEGTDREKEQRRQEAEAAYHAWLQRKATERKRGRSIGRGLIADVPPITAPKISPAEEHSNEEKQKRRAEAEAAFQAWLERKKEAEKERKRAMMVASKSLQNVYYKREDPDEAFRRWKEQKNQQKRQERCLAEENWHQFETVVPLPPFVDMSMNSSSSTSFAIFRRRAASSQNRRSLQTPTSARDSRGFSHLPDLAATDSEITRRHTPVSKGRSELAATFRSNIRSVSPWHQKRNRRIIAKYSDEAQHSSAFPPVAAP